MCCGGADHNFQSTKGAYKPKTDQDEAALGHKMFAIIEGNEGKVLQAEDNQVMGLSLSLYLLLYFNVLKVPSHSCSNPVKAMRTSTSFRLKYFCLLVMYSFFF